MHSNSFALARNRFDVPVEGNDLGLDADLFSEFARGRHGKRLAYFDHAARQGETPDHRLARSTDDKHPALTKDGLETARIGRAGKSLSFMGRFDDLAWAAPEIKGRAAAFPRALPASRA